MAIASTFAKPATGSSALTLAAEEQGSLLFVDDNRLGQVDDDTIVLHRKGPAGDGITMHGNRPVEDFVSYISLGHARLLSGVLQMDTAGPERAQGRAGEQRTSAHRQDQGSLFLA